MPLSAGEKLGPYEILAPIGAGGMGEVYRARDTRLNREVAIKVAAERFSERFEKEAHAIASLNHPNICTLHDVGPNYLVMELVEGPTLADRVAAGKIPLAETLGIARQIAEALEAAHEKNIVHRDLKPANIKIKPDGAVKVLDFGLAKTTEPGGSGSNPDNSPTLTLQDATRAGVILGTAGYMSPEQAAGKPVDKRADIWAFGVVLWELLTGKRMFAGETVSHTLAAVLIQEPAWQQLPPETPASLRRLLKRCLERDLKRRLADIGTARLEIEEAAQGGPERASEGPAGSGRQALPWVTAGVLAVSLGGLAFVHFREPAPAAEITRFQIPLPAGSNVLGPFPSFEVSPDGRKLAFVASGTDGKPHLWIRSLDALDARPLPGIEPSVNPLTLFWSPDSRFLAFQSTDNKLKKVDIAGGPAQTICDVSPAFLGGSWGRDGVILFALPSRGVMRVAETGGTPTALTAVEPDRKERGHLFPHFLPDGRHFLYFRDLAAAEEKGIYVGAIDLKPAQQSRKPLLPNEAFPEYYVPSGDSGRGYLLFYREGSVLAQPFDPSRQTLGGDPVPVAEPVGNFSGVIGFFSASAQGVLASVGGSARGNAQLTWFDRDGKNLGTVGEPENFRQRFAISRDGKQAVASRIESRTANLWLLDFTRGGASSRFTFDNFLDDYPVWSPDGSRIVFSSNRDGRWNLYQKLSNAARDETLLLKSDEDKFPYGWSGDGRYLLYSVQTAKDKDDIWILPMEGSPKPMPFQATPFNESAAQFSPDGRWVSYISDESGNPEVYVREFSLGSDGKPEPTAKHQISTGGQPIAAFWRDDGKELMYGTGDGKVMSVEITVKPGFLASPPKMLFQGPGGVRAGAVSDDGKRFLFAAPAGQNGPPQFTVVQNWQAGLKK